MREVLKSRNLIASGGHNTGYIRNDRFYYIYNFDGDRVNYEKMTQQIDQMINYRAEELKKQAETLKNLDALIEKRNQIFADLEANTKELQNLKDCFCGREDIIYDKIRY